MYHPAFFALLSICLIAGCSNFHEVTPGELYRSGQLSAKQFDRYIKQYGIKTVINLRGESKKAKWYKEEMKVMGKDSVNHINIRLFARRYIPPMKVDSIINLAVTAEKPILVHCQGGADRSGLFCAAWKLKIEKRSAEESSKQLSFVYGHIPYLIWRKTAAMDSSFRDYTRLLKK